MKRRQIEEFHWIRLMSLEMHIVKPFSLKRSSSLALSTPNFPLRQARRTKRMRDYSVVCNPINQSINQSIRQSSNQAINRSVTKSKEKGLEF